MFSIQSIELPVGTLLDNYSKTPGNYTDCFVVDVFGQVDLKHYIIAFYNSPLFKLERLLLSLVLRRSSTDLQVSQLADGDLMEFAAWTVEKREKDQILMCDVSKRTRSWLMVTSNNSSSFPGTRLYFGSAVLPNRSVDGANASIGLGYSSLIGVHRFYSRALLWSAKVRIAKLG
ncbi:MAG: hypothetical protein AAGA30_14565 [Planctomycetota bacterium]